MEIQAFQLAACQCGFIELHECGDGTTMWLRKAAADAVTGTHQRMCIDRLTNSASVYWTDVQGQFDSKTFRNVTALLEWIGGITLVQPSNTVALESSFPGDLQSVPLLSIGVGKGSS
jgi:hypothetical protein